MKIYCLVLALASLSAAQDPWLPRLLGSFELPHAAFVEVFQDSDVSGPDGMTLVMSTFNAAALLSHDPVYYIQEPGNYMDFINSWDQLLEPLGQTETAYWPNYPIPIPKEIAGFDGVLQTSGFIPPGKTYGQLEVYNLETTPPTGPWNIASLDDKDYSYHWVEFKDIDGDGLKDALTARFHVGLLGQTNSELVWMKNPGGLGDDGTNWEDWEQNVLIAEGPDVVFSFIKLEAEGTTYEVMVTSELWTESIMLYYVEDGVAGAWSDPANIMSVVIDDSPGQPFEARAVDVNLDGTLEVMASAFDGSVSDGGNLFLYIQPADWRQSNWERKVLATGFEANNYIFGNSMTPGKHRVFYPSNDYEAGSTEFGPNKPWISLSGDDDGKHYVLYPKSEDRDNYEYDLHLIIDTEKTTSGTMAVVDLDGDGFMEIISAGYTANTVYVHTYAP